jgi:hypothetical protein
MKEKKLPAFAYFLMWYLQSKGVKLAYHQDLQCMLHLAVIRHDPAKKEQFGSFLYPGEQYDLWEPCPETTEGWFTIIDSDGLWKMVNFTLFLGFDFKMFSAIKRAIKRLN